MDKKEKDTLRQRQEYIARKVKEWQEFPYVRSLTCKQEGCDGILEPKITKTTVILKCPKCSRVQYYIPKNILRTKLGKPDVLIRNQYLRRLWDIDIS